MMGLHVIAATASAWLFDEIASFNAVLYGLSGEIFFPILWGAVALHISKGGGTSELCFVPLQSGLFFHSKPLWLVGRIL